MYLVVSIKAFGTSESDGSVKVINQFESGKDVPVFNYLTN
jgi:hypothetical protein